MEETESRSCAGVEGRAPDETAGPGSSLLGNGECADLQGTVAGATQAPAQAQQRRERASHREAQTCAAICSGRMHFAS